MLLTLSNENFKCTSYVYAGLSVNESKLIESKWKSQSQLPYNIQDLIIEDWKSGKFTLLIYGE